MVLLTMTPAIVNGIQQMQKFYCDESHFSSGDLLILEPLLASPKTGNPISHAQVVKLSCLLKANALSPYHLDTLLFNTSVYFPPSPPKPAKSPEYLALMARLRKEAEAREYERMLNPPPPTETFSQRFHNSSAYAFSSTSAYLSSLDAGESDEAAIAEVNKQLTLVVNVLVSIICCSAALWIVARWWSTPARLALSFGGSLLVAVAEVGIYWGYEQKVKIAQAKERGVKEVKEVLETWEVSGGKGNLGQEKATDDVQLSKEQGTGLEDGVRKRKKVTNS